MVRESLGPEALAAEGRVTEAGVTTAGLRTFFRVATGREGVDMARFAVARFVVGFDFCLRTEAGGAVLVEEDDAPVARALDRDVADEDGVVADDVVARGYDDPADGDEGVDAEADDGE